MENSRDLSFPMVIIGYLCLWISMANHTLLVEESIGMKIHGLIHKDRIHRTVWMINARLAHPLERGEDIKVDFDGELSYFPCYYTSVPESDSDYYFVRNRGTHGFFIQEYRQIDFVLIERNYDCNFDPTLSNQLFEAGVKHCIEIDYETLKKKTRSNLEI